MNHKVQFQEKKLEEKQEKNEIVPKMFDSVYSAVNARLKTSIKMHLFDLILKSPRIYCRLYVCTQAKKHRFSRYLLYYFGSNSIFS